MMSKTKKLVNNIKNLISEGLLTLLKDKDNNLYGKIYISAKLAGIQYMSVLVSLEEEMDFEIPDEYLGQDILSSFQRLCDIVFESIGV